MRDLTTRQAAVLLGVSLTTLRAPRLTPVLARLPGGATGPGDGALVVPGDA